MIIPANYKEWTWDHKMAVALALIMQHQDIDVINFHAKTLGGTLESNGFDFKVNVDVDVYGGGIIKVSNNSSLPKCETCGTPISQSIVDKCEEIFKRRLTTDC